MTGISGNTLYVPVHGAQTRVSLCLSTPIYVYSYVRCVYALVYGRKRERGTVAGRVLHA